MRNLLLLAVLGVAVGAGYLFVREVAFKDWFDVRNALSAPSHAERVAALEALPDVSADVLFDWFEDPDTGFDHRRALGEVLLTRHGRLVLLGNALNSDVAGVRYMAAHALASTRQEVDRDRVLEVLTEWASDASSGFHMLCVTALRESFPGKESIEPLTEIFRRAPSDGARMQAGNLLLMMTRMSQIDVKEHPELLPRLLEVAASDDDRVVPLVRARGFQIFVALGGRDAEVLRELVDSSESMCRQITAHVLGYLELEEVEPFLRKLLVDRNEVVRRAALDAMNTVGTSELITEWAPRLREDSFVGVRRDLALVAQSQEVETDVVIRSLVLGLLDPEPDSEVQVVRASLQALERLTKKHYGFPDAMFDSMLPPADRYRAVEEGYAAWAKTPHAERRAAVQPWFADYGEPNRRAVLLAQLDHPDPKCAAWAVLELTRLDPDAATPGFDGTLVTNALRNRNTMEEPFLKLVEAVDAHRDDGSWATHVTAWKKAHR